MKHKGFWIGAIVGGLYALLPPIIQFIFNPNEFLQILLVLPFILVARTFLFITLIIGKLAEIFGFQQLGKSNVLIFIIIFNNKI